MNYPTKNAIIDYIKRGDCNILYNTVTELYSSYPRSVCDCLMNLLGTHDTERILTVLAGECSEGHTNAELSVMRLSEDEKKRGIALLKMASALQYTLYGFPSVFYGDEAGSEGYRDPFCRMPFPWGKENAELLSHYKALGKLRRDHSAYTDGDFKVTAHDGGLFAFTREDENEKLLTIVNRASFEICYNYDGKWKNALTGEVGEGNIKIASDAFLVIELL